MRSRSFAAVRVAVSLFRGEELRATQLSLHSKPLIMPLITFSGLPCSGKTTYATHLVEQLNKKIQECKDNSQPGHNLSVIYHSDDTLGISPDAYTDSAQEKHARGTQMSAVKRDLARNTIVVLDTMAYIKGFRYQLYCEAKGIATPHCVVQVANSEDTCVQWNKKSNKWPEEVIRQLSMRYEEPNGDTRWDAPLFTVVAGSDEVPLNEIWDCLVHKKVAPPNAATLVKPTSGTEFLQQLDQRTLAVISAIIQHQQLASVGGQVKFENTVVEMPPRPVSTAQLQRIRRTFVALNRMRSIDLDRITPLFVEYVNRAFESE